MDRGRWVEDANQDVVLHWLDTHSVSTRRGLSADLLQQKWSRAGHDPAALLPTIEALLAAQWVEVTPGINPPHVRYSATGYARLLELTDVIAPEPSAPDQPDSAPPTPRPNYLADRGVLTEIGARNQVLQMFRELRLEPGDQLIAVTVSRYWQEYGQRAEDLRRALEVVLRDGYLVSSTERTDTFWRLTESGHRYLKLPPPPEVLMALAPPMSDRRVDDSAPDDALREEILKLIRKHGRGAALDWDALSRAWSGRTRLGINALIHGVDLLLKAGAISWQDGPPPRVQALRDKP